MYYYIESLGCAKNLVDSERFAAIMASYGMQEVWNAAEADVILVNSCAFLHRALEELDIVLSSIIDLLQGSKAKLIATGCVTTRCLAEFQELFPEVDAWIMLKDFKGFEQYLCSDVLPKGSKAQKPQAGGRVKFQDGQHVYLRISDGCENYCSYCMIPSIRGKLVSEPIEKLVAEAKAMSPEGEELVLIAQDTCMYGTDVYGEKALPKLIDALCELDLYKWIRVMYMHPDHFDISWLQLWKKHSCLLPYFEIPIQHVSPRVIRSMNRQKSYDELKALFTAIKHEIPQAVFRTTLMVGYPNETQSDLDMLDKFLQEVDILHIGVFGYSPEKEGFADPEDDPRHQYVENLEMKYAKRIAQLKEDKMQAFVGTLQKGIIESYDPENDSFIGRLWWQAPEIDGIISFDNEPKSDSPFVDVEITDALADELTGIIKD